MTSALDLLEADHDRVKEQFQSFTDSEDPVAKRGMAQSICRALTEHAELEEKLFYPVARNHLKTDDRPLVDKALEDHAKVKELIAAIEQTNDPDALDGAMEHLQEVVEVHVEEEEGELFPAVEESNMPLADVGQLIADQKTARGG
jgi:hemerythrin superfamily protein